MGIPHFFETSTLTNEYVMESLKMLMDLIDNDSILQRDIHNSIKEKEKDNPKVKSGRKQKNIHNPRSGFSKLLAFEPCYGVRAGVVRRDIFYARAAGKTLCSCSHEATSTTRKRKRKKRRTRRAARRSERRKNRRKSVSFSEDT